MGYLDDIVTRSKKEKGALTPAIAEAQPKPSQAPAVVLRPPPAPADVRGTGGFPDASKKPEGFFAGKKEEAPKAEVAGVELKGVKSVVTSYGDVVIYQVEGEPLPVYAVPVVKPVGPEKVILSTVKEAATRLITVAPEEIRDPTEKRKFYFRRVKEIIESSPELGVPKTKIDFYADMVVREMIGYGVLDPLVGDPRLEEIMVIGPNRPVYVYHREFEMLKTNIVFAADEEVTNIIARIGRDVNRRVDVQNPLLDARLPDGSRVNATIKPISIEGATLTIRKFREDPFTVIDLINYGTLNAELGAFLWLAVDGMRTKPANILISGGAGSGKTSMLNVLASFVPPGERIIIIEDVSELRLPFEHIVRFETRPPGLEGTGEITMDALVKNSLRMRPDRIVVGEVRHSEAFTLFTAINTGHDGSMGTIHANSAAETIVRLMNPPMSVPAMMLEALDFVLVEQRVHERKKGTVRRVTELGEVEPVAGGEPTIQLIYEWDAASDTIKPTGLPSRYVQKLQRFSGMPKGELHEELERRKRLLEDLAARGIRKQEDIVREFRKFQT